MSKKSVNSNYKLIKMPLNFFISDYKKTKSFSPLTNLSRYMHTHSWVCLKLPLFTVRKNASCLMLCADWMILWKGLQKLAYKTKAAECLSRVTNQELHQEQKASSSFASNWVQNRYYWGTRENYKTHNTRNVNFMS